MMPRNPIEADWLIRCAEEDAARAERRAAIAQQHAAYQIAVAKAHVADAAGLRALWNFEHLPGLRPVERADRPPPGVAEDIPAPEPPDPPKCEYCGKPTRIWRGKPQRFCSFPKDRPGYTCATRFRDRRNSELKKSATAMAGVAGHSEVSCAEIDAGPPQEPTCLQCGKPTRIWHGKRQKFCSPPPGRHVSPCASAFHDRARRAGSTPRAPRGPLRPVKQPEPVRPSGSVLATASPRAPGHALLASVTQAIPQNLPEDLRSEIISESMLLILEGVQQADAITQASKSVRKNAAPLRYTKAIDDCFWLAAEATSGEQGIP